jgi:hypothetical protein
MYKIVDNNAKNANQTLKYIAKNTTATIISTIVGMILNRIYLK